MKKQKKKKRTGDRSFYFYMLLVLGVSLLPLLTIGQEDEDDETYGRESEGGEDRAGKTRGRESESGEDRNGKAHSRESESGEDRNGKTRGRGRESGEDRNGKTRGRESESGEDRNGKTRGRGRESGEDWNGKTHGRKRRGGVTASDIGQEAFERTHTSRAKKIGSGLYLVIVLGICLLPLLAMGVRSGQDGAENRTLASMPELVDQEGFHWDYLSETGEYFDDHFAFRSELVSLDAWVRTSVFAVSPVSDVIAGEDGWLYYTATLDDFQHKNPATDRMLYNIAHNVALMQRYAESLGVEFLFTVAPNKNSLYGEHMPWRLRRQVEAQSDMERLLFWLEEQQVNYVDLFRLFREQEEVLYYQRDSHWNRKGAVLVYNTLLDACGKTHETYEDSRTQIVNDYYGDLNRMLYPIGGEPEQDIDYMGGNEWSYRTGETVEDSLIITESAEGSQTLLMYRDSFGNSLLPLLAGEYSQAVFSKIVPYPMTDLAVYWPDVVIVEKVERHLPTLAEVPPLMSAPETVLDGTRMQVESNTAISLTKEGSYWKLSGLADEAYLAVDSPIFLEVTDADGTRVYEAFCLSRSEEETGDNGFALYLSELALSGDLLHVKVITKGDGGLLILGETEFNLKNG